MGGGRTLTFGTLPVSFNCAILRSTSVFIFARSVSSDRASKLPTSRMVTLRRACS